MYRMCRGRSLSQEWNGRSDMQYVLSTYCDVTDLNKFNYVIFFRYNWAVITWRYFGLMRCWRRWLSDEEWEHLSSSCLREVALMICEECWWAAEEGEYRCWWADKESADDKLLNMSMAYSGDNWDWSWWPMIKSGKDELMAMSWRWAAEEGDWRLWSNEEGECPMKNENTYHWAA